MNWEAISAIGEVVGALAVVVTLAYLARQVRQSNRQDLLTTLQHNYDSTNQFLTSTLESGELADLVIRGRASYESLSEPERLRFDHFHFVILNIVESHLLQIERTAGRMERGLASFGKENMRVIVQGYLAHPGTRTFWAHVEPYFEVSVHKFIADALEAVPAADAES